MHQDVHLIILLIFPMPPILLLAAHWSSALNKTDREAGHILLAMFPIINRVLRLDRLGRVGGTPRRARTGFDLVSVFLIDLSENYLSNMMFDRTYSLT